MKNTPSTGNPTVTPRAAAKRFALVVFSALSLALLAACQSERPTPTPEPGKATTVALSLEALPLVEVGTDTRAATDLALPAEQRVYNLWVVQYDKGTGTRVGQPQYIDILSDRQNGANINISVDLTSSTAIQQLYFLANTNDPTILNSTNTSSAATLTTLTQALASEFLPNATNSGLPMFGMKESIVTSGTPINDIELQRLVAKIKLLYKVNAANFPGFTVTGVRLRNISGTFGYLPQPADGSNYPVKSTYSHFDYNEENPASAGSDAGYSTFTWYTPENLRAAAGGVPSDLNVTKRTLANTADQAATHIEITGLTDDDRLITYSLLLGQTDASGNGNDFNLRRNTIYTVTFDINGANIADHRIVSTPITTILPAQTANTYMITPGTGISFPTKIKGNEATNTLATQSVGLLWQDVSGLVKSTTYDSGTGRTLILINGTKGSGNFLAAAYDGPNGTGNILWSWHIWVTDYKPSEAGVAVRTANTSYAVTGGQVHTYGTQFQTANGTSRTIMDRNLGATIGYNTTVPTTATEATGTYGMAYEWGRKDPFPPAITTGTTTGPSIPLYNASGVVIPAASAPTIVDVGGTPGGTTVANSILNPTTFYYNTITTSTFDWADPQDATLWLPTSKTLYDPCPKGWRVPPQNTWMDFTRTSATVGTFLWYNSGVLNTSTETLGSQNGRRYTAGTVNAWYPASGFRDWNGMVAAGQTNGQWASSTTTTGTSHYLYFAPSFLWTDSFCTRSSGLSVRCVQE